ncbi:hypothetical protein GIS00_05430 [Nakamurella sp. YIM 132087]|uniref:PH domain-containing protein n=1 Tax=Nakamurella alba TaxID=2665158 RepID=A0A7K1FH15_9ACTN|nr:hypothetical protein [Nakamurella alba]MTD13388.1 hypothetical protein [Nakamurella alba]
MADNEELILRNPARKFSVVIVCLMLALSVVLLVIRPGSQKVVGAIGVVVFATLACTILRSNLRCGPSGVVLVTEIGRRRRWSWSEIDRFEERGVKGIGLVTRPRKWVVLTGWATLGPVPQERITEMLEARRKKYQVLGPDDGPPERAAGTG